MKQNALQAPTGRVFVRAASVLSLAALAAAHAGAATLKVPSQYPTIQLAIAAAADGDVVLVSRGTYYGMLDFLDKAITLRSVDGPTFTIVDAQGAGTAVTIASPSNKASRLSGFTIRGGDIPPGNDGWTAGGSGIRATSGSVTIDNNVVTNNQGCPGSGIYVADGSSFNVHDNHVTLNNQDCIGPGSDSGAVAVTASAGTGGRIVDNTIDANGGDFIEYGGGVFVGSFATGKLLIRGNVITNNYANFYGGGLAVMGAAADQGTLEVSDNVIYGNWAYSGGGIYFHSPAPTRFINNTVADDRARDGYDEMYVEGFLATDPLVFANNVFYGYLYCDGTASQAVNNDTYPRAYYWTSGHCGFDGPTNLGVDPLFSYYGVEPYIPLTNSPLIDAGSNDALGTLKVDEHDKPRVVDGKGTGHAVVDIGAYEQQAPAQ